MLPSLKKAIECIPKASELKLKFKKNNLSYVDFFGYANSS